MSKFANAVQIQTERVGKVNPEVQAAAARVEKLQSEGPATVQTPVETISEATIAGGKASLGVTQVPERPAPTGTIEQFEQIKNSPQRHQVMGENGELRDATDEELWNDYRAELAENRQKLETYNSDQDVVTVPDDIAFSPNSGGIDRVSVELARFTNAAAGAKKDTKAGLTATGAFEFVPPQIESALGQLGMLEQAGATGNKKRVKQGAAGAMYLAMLIGIKQAMNPGEVGDFTGTIGDNSGQAVGSTKRASPEDETNIPNYKITQEVGKALKMMAAPSASIDPETGVASEVGYVAPEGITISEVDEANIGEFILSAGRAAGLVMDPDFDRLTDETAYIEKLKTPGHDSYKYNIKPNFFQLTNELAPLLESVAPQLKRPVSLVPNPGGKSVGSKALGQREITYTPIEGASEITPQMHEALDAIGRTPNFVIDDNLDIAERGLADTIEKMNALDVMAKQKINYAQKRKDLVAAAKRDPDNPRAFDPVRELDWQLEETKASMIEEDPTLESPLASLFDLDQQTFMDRVETSEVASTNVTKLVWHEGQWVKSWALQVEKKVEPWADQQAVQDQWTRDRPPREGEEFSALWMRKKRKEDNLTHLKFARQVRAAAKKAAQDVINDARKRQGQVFYYQGTVIGNSGRIMIANTELNYQSNKLARFLVGNPKPVTFTIGSGAKSEKGFRYVIARNIIDGADQYHPDHLMKIFNQSKSEPDSFQSRVNPYAKSLYLAKEAGNHEAFDNAFRGIKKDLKGVVPKDWGASDEWGFALEGLLNWGEYLVKMERGGGTMATRVTAEGDGINNGSSIQGLQFGTKTVIERSGYMYDPNHIDPETGKLSGKVIPFGNMRDALFDSMNTFASTLPADRTKTAMKYRGLMGRIQAAGLKKKLVKIPLMTTVYGKPANTHVDHIKEVLQANATKLGLDGKRLGKLNEYAEVLSSGLVYGLKETLGESLVHQNLVKKGAGLLMFAAEEIPFITGANGFRWQAGGFDMEIVQNPFTETPSFRTPWKTLTPSGERGTVGVQRDKGANVKRSKEEKPVSGSSILLQERVPSALAMKEVKGADDARPSSVLRNQLAVNGTHNIDSTIAQETVVEFRKRGLWGHQIYDAFMGDAESFGEILDIANQKFDEVNKRYSLLKQEHLAYKEAMDAFYKKLDAMDRDEFDLLGDYNPEAGAPPEAFLRGNGDFRGLAYMIASTVGGKGMWKGDMAAQQDYLRKAGIETVIEIPEGKKRPSLLLDYSSLRSLSKNQIRDIMKTYQKNFGFLRQNMDPSYKGKRELLNIDESFDLVQENFKRQKAELFKEYKDSLGDGRQYN